MSSGDASRRSAPQLAAVAAELCLDLTPLLAAETTDTAAAAARHDGSQPAAGWQDLDAYVRQHILAQLSARQQAAVVPVARAWRNDVATIVSGRGHLAADVIPVARQLLERQRLGLVEAAEADTPARRLERDQILAASCMGAYLGFAAGLIIFTAASLSGFEIRGREVVVLPSLFAGAVAVGLAVLLRGWRRSKRHRAHVVLRRFDREYHGLFADMPCPPPRLGIRLWARHLAETNPAAFAAPAAEKAALSAV